MEPNIIVMCTVGCTVGRAERELLLLLLLLLLLWQTEFNANPVPATVSHVCVIITVYSHATCTYKYVCSVSVILNIQ
jgi:hypothetical protein